MSEDHKTARVNLKKVLHEPVAPYFASSYNTLMSIVQGCALSAVCYRIFSQPELSWSIIAQGFSTWLIIGLIWHRYVTHFQYIAWRLATFDTIIPMGFAILQFWVIFSIQTTAYDFSFAYISLPAWGIVAYLNSVLQYNNPFTKILFQEHFKDQGEDFYEALFWELNNFQRYSLLLMIAASILFTIIFMFVKNTDLSEEIKIYCSCSLYSIVIIALFYWDINCNLKRSKKDALKQYFGASC